MRLLEVDLLMEKLNFVALLGYKRLSIFHKFCVDLLPIAHRIILYSPLQGTNLNQDTRFSDKEKKLLKQMKFSDVLSKKVDMSKVKLDVLRPWISAKITQLLNLEDDVIEEYVVNQLEEEKFPSAKKMQ